MQQQEVSTFKDDRYVDTVREVYMELMSMQVGAKNVERIVRAVIEKMTTSTIGRVPKASFAKYMLLEARTLALCQLKEKIQEADNITVGIDGTSKFGHHFGAVEVSFEGQHSMVLGMRDMVGGEAQMTNDRTDINLT